MNAGRILLIGAILTMSVKLHAKILDVQGPFHIAASGSTFYTVLRTNSPSAVGHCLQNDGGGQFKDYVTFRSKRNGAIAGAEEIIIAPNGEFSFVNQVHIDRSNDYSETYERRYLCTVTEDSYDLLRNSKFYEKLKGIDQFSGAVECGAKDETGRRSATILFHQGVTLEQLGGDRLCNPEVTPDARTVFNVSGYYPAESLAPFYYERSGYANQAFYSVYQGYCSKGAGGVPLATAKDLLIDCQKEHFMIGLRQASSSTGQSLLLGIDSRHFGGIIED